MVHSEMVPPVIGVLTVLGLIFQASAWLNYSSELKFINVLRTRISDLLDSKDSKPLKAEDLLEEETVPEASLVGTRTVELEKFSQYPGMVALHDLGAVAAEGDEGRLKNAIPSVLIASLLVCGLFGTLLSLKETLQDPSLTVFIGKGGVATSSSFQESLGSVVQGFGGAFTASIYGVGGTIILIFGRVFVRARRERCFEEIEHYVVDHLLPYYIEPEKTQLQRAAAIITETTLRFETVTGKMNNSSSLMNKAVEELKESTSQANVTFGHEGAVVYQLSEFVNRAEKFNNNAVELAELHARSTQALESLSVSNTTLVSSLNGSIEHQKESQKESADQVTSMTTKLLNANDKTKVEFIQGVKSLETTQHKVIESLNKSAEKQIEHGNELVEAVANSYGGSLNQLNVENKNLLDLLKKHNDDLLEKRIESHDQLTTNLNSLTAKVEEVALKEDRVDIESFTEFRVHLDGINTKLDEVLKANSGAIDNSFKIHDKMDQKMMKSFEEFSTRINTLSRVVDKIADAGSLEHNTVSDKIKNFFGR